jgi:hypothetical protein
VAILLETVTPRVQIPKAFAEPQPTSDIGVVILAFGVQNTK